MNNNGSPDEHLYEFVNVKRIFYNSSMSKPDCCSAGNGYSREPSLTTTAMAGDATENI